MAVKLTKVGLEVVGLERQANGHVCIHFREATLEQRGPVTMPADTPREIMDMSHGIGAMISTSVQSLSPYPQPMRAQHVLVLTAEEYEKLPLTVGRVITITLESPEDMAT